ncbi:MAG: cysteine desulfurase family protein [Bernardetiaceae bacterium]
MPIYLDNAATTSLDASVLDAMLPYLKQHYGNPSSTHAFGRAAKGAVETARKKVADLLGVTPAEIVFTSGGTEADNLALRGAIDRFGVRHVCTTRLEHHAVLHTLESLAAAGSIQLHFLETDEKGRFAMPDLEAFLAAHPQSLVSLMHGNNEIGNLIDLAEISACVQAHGGYFHSDTVQTTGHFDLQLREVGVHYTAASAHKFHGPKGVGFAFIEKNHKIPAQQTGGSQERGIRAGTHNVASIVGLAAALEKAIHSQETHRYHILQLKKSLHDGLRSRFKSITFNGLSDDMAQSLYTVLSVSFPRTSATEMLLFQLDIRGICASGGSACSSGSDQGSHVIRALGQQDIIPVRFSFSKCNGINEIETVLDTLTELLPDC